MDARGVLRTRAVGDGSSCFTSSSLMSSCLTAGVRYGSSLVSSIREGLRSQSGDSRSMDGAGQRRPHEIRTPKKLREVSESMSRC